MTDNNNGAWESLNWKEKVQICQQAIDGEDSLLYSFITIFIAIEAILFVAVFSNVWQYQFGVVIISVLGILIAFMWWRFMKPRGKAVDRWGAVLHKLWQDVDLSQLEKWEQKVVSELVEYHKGSFIRREGVDSSGNKVKWPRMRIVYSVRWWLTSFLPFLLIVTWIFILVDCISCI